MRWIEILTAFILVGSACSSPPSVTDEQAAFGDSALPTVQVVSPTRRHLTRELRLPGSVEAFEKAVLYAMAAGYLKNIFVDKGDRVRKGQVLAELEMPEVASEVKEIGARLAEARANAELKRLTFDRLSAVHEKEPDLISQHEIDVARAEMDLALAAVSVAEASLAKLEALIDYGVLKAPFAGIVTERFVDPGALIQTAAATREATPVVTVMNMSMVRVYVHLPESEVASVRRGAPARLEIDALRGRRFEGAVTRFTSALDPATRTMKVEIDLANPDGALLHGMYGTVMLVIGESQNALTLPSDSLLSQGETEYVLCVENGDVVRRQVTTGISDGQVVEILSGLEGGERVVIGDTSDLREGMKVNVQESLEREGEPK